MWTFAGEKVRESIDSLTIGVSVNSYIKRATVPTPSAIVRNKKDRHKGGQEINYLVKLSVCTTVPGASPETGLTGPGPTTTGALGASTIGLLSNPYS